MNTELLDDRPLGVQVPCPRCMVVFTVQPRVKTITVVDPLIPGVTPPGSINISVEFEEFHINQHHCDRTPTTTELAAR